MNWHEHFVYDEDSPSCLRWKRFAANNRVKPGDIAGHLAGKKIKDRKYFRVRCLEKSYAVSRIIWEMFNGEIPEGFQVDHFDINCQNNKISNLRLVSNLHNSQNKRRNRINSSGCTGVHLGDNGRGRLYWTAQWNDTTGKRCKKAFSVDRHGNDQAFNLAVSARAEAIQSLNTQGMNYTERHGK